MTGKPTIDRHWNQFLKARFGQTASATKEWYDSVEGKTLKTQKDTWQNRPQEQWKAFGRDKECKAGTPSREQLPLIHEKGEPIAYKSHDWEGVNERDRVIFILRDYAEVMVRNNKVDNFIPSILGYMRLLANFDKHKGDKILIEYEDLIGRTDTSTKLVIGQLSKFLGGVKWPSFTRACCPSAAELTNNIDEHRRKALKKYPKSQTKGDKKIKHANKIDKQTLKAWRKFVSNNYGSLHRKYFEEAK